MEDLLASIRKAIHEDIGEMPAAAVGKEVSPAPHRAPEEASSASSEIQQLRAKITRARGGEVLPPAAAPEPAPRAAGLAAALQSETPRRSWREIEPPPPLTARLRGSVAEPEFHRPAPPRPEALPPAPPAATRLPPPRGETPPAAMLSGASAQAVQTAFSRLADTVLTRATGERSVEDLTRELLKVMLKQWLDDNLPAMVERLVREEIERVARNGR